MMGTRSESPGDSKRDRRGHYMPRLSPDRSQRASERVASSWLAAYAYIEPRCMTLAGLFTRRPALLGSPFGRLVGVEEASLLRLRDWDLRPKYTDRFIFRKTNPACPPGLARKGFLAASSSAKC